MHRKISRKRDITQAIAILIGAFVLIGLLKWGFAEYYTATHCQLVLGTTVCQ